MTGNTTGVTLNNITLTNIKVKEFNEFFIKNYNYLLGFSKSINPQSDYESLLHDCYLRCHKRIDLSGYSGQTFINFVRVTIINTYKQKYGDNKRMQFVSLNNDYEDNCNINRVERVLQDTNDYEEKQRQIDNEMIFYNTMAFEYVNKYFNEKENMIFKTYYVLKSKHLNYKQLSCATGISITTVSNIIKKIKKELRENLICYINYNKKCNE